MKAHLVIYTTHFPTPHEPNRDIFTAQLVEGLSHIYKVSVVSPVPWWPNLPGVRKFGAYRLYAGLPSRYRRGSVDVHHPRYFIVPGLPLILHSWLQYATTRRLLNKLHRRARIDAINAHWVYPDGVSASRLAKNLGCPIMLTALGSDINVSVEFPFRRRQISRALQPAEAASGISRALTSRLVALGAPAHCTHYLPNGVNKEIFNPAPPEMREQLCQRLGLDSSRKYLLFVGRLHPIKGLKHLVAALYLLANEGRLNFDTLLIGGGESESEIKNDICMRGLGKSVRLVGSVAHSAVRDWLRIGDAFCLPSLMEGMPNVILEAMACGVPIVASCVGAIPDVVNAESGILVAPGDPVALAKAIAEVMTRKWDRSRIAEAGGTPDWNEVAGMYAQVIDGMIAANISRADLSAG